MAAGTSVDVFRCQHAYFEEVVMHYGAHGAEASSNTLDAHSKEVDAFIFR